MDNKIFNPDVLLVCHISHIGLYWRTGQRITYKKITLCVSVFLVFLSLVKSDTAQLKLSLCIHQDFWWKLILRQITYSSSPWMAIIIKEKLKKTAKNHQDTTVSYQHFYVPKISQVHFTCWKQNARVYGKVASATVFCWK